MDNQTGSYPRADIRLSDAERDQAITELGEHFQAGRLTQEEFDDRSGRALQARTGRPHRAVHRPAASRRRPTPVGLGAPSSGFGGWPGYRGARRAAAVRGLLGLYGGGACFSRLLGV